MSEREVEGLLDKSMGVGGHGATVARRNIANVVSDSDNGLNNEGKTTSSREDETLGSSREEKRTEGERAPKPALRHRQGAWTCGHPDTAAESGRSWDSAWM